MKIVDVREELVQDTKRAVATVVWERRKSPSQDIYVSIGEDYADMLTVSSNAFLIATLWPAMYHFEKRVSIEGELCPLLVENLTRAMALLHDWYKDAPVVQIEGDIAGKPFPPAEDGRSALMFSGGLDSLASLKANRNRHTSSDPDWFEYGLIVASGFDGFDMSPSGAFWPEMAAVAAETSLTLVPASTNLRELEPADHFFQHYLHSALLATIGHSLTSEIRSLAIASTHDDKELAWGSHAYLDPLYSSGALKVTHDLPTMSRYEKTRLIADWPGAQSHMKVCFVAGRLPTGKWNCCECEKCIRTMLTLMSMSKLEEFEVFERSHLAPEDVDRSLELGESSVRYYTPIISAFEKSGDTTMVEVLRRKVREVREHQTRNLLQRVKAFDKNILGGGLRRMKRRLLD